MNLMKAYFIFINRTCKIKTMKLHKQNVQIKRVQLKQIITKSLTSPVMVINMYKKLLYNVYKKWK